MPRLLPLACLVLLFITGKATAQKEKVAPPGTIHLKDNLYIDKVPVTIDSYNEFLRSIQTFWSEKIHNEIDSLPTFGLTVAANKSAKAPMGAAEDVMYPKNFGWPFNKE